jgi:PAS domain S-box-containing protein
MAATLILNVDDAPAHRYAKTRILQHAGYEVVEAGTGAKALELVNELRPDLVLLDLNLPDMNGMEVCSTIKATRLGSRMPVVHISATSVGAEYETASLEHGADVYLPEPVEPQTLLTVVGVLLRLRRTEAGLAQSEERMRLATEAAGIATWEIDLDTGMAVWSGELYRLLGYAPDTVRPSWSAWQACIHPDDRARVTEALRHARETESLFREEHRILRHDDGAERYVAPFGRVYGDERGEPTRFLGVLMDLTERQRAAAEREHLLEQANAARAEAEYANRLKDQFLASLSHELRTPMHAILGWMQLLRGGALRASEREQALTTIERNARLQNQLINELLDVSRAISGKLEVQMGNVELREVLDAALESVRPMAEAKQIRLAPSLDQCLGTIPADPARLQQILGNLLSNAVKFTPEGGLVTVDCAARDGKAEITVTDNGEGIAPEHLPHVFEAFRQADGSITRRHGGLGLGLSIVQQLVQLHGGTVRAESDGLGRGSRFTISLPVAGATEPLFPTRPGRDAQHAGGTRLRDLTILAVDDNEDMLQLMEEMLRWEGAVVTTATTAAAALQSAREHRPDVLILDIGMPDMHGYELLSALRGACPARNGRMPAIAVTGYASVEDAARAMAAGFQAHLAKPFEMNELFTLLEALAPAAARGRM